MGIIGDREWFNSPATRPWGTPKRGDDGNPYESEVTDLSIELGLEPGVNMSSGCFHIHFMNESDSLVYDRTIQEELQELLDDQFPETSDDLEEAMAYRKILSEMVASLDLAISRYKSK